MSITSLSDRNPSNSSSTIFELVGSVIRYFTGAPNPHVVDTVARIATEMHPQFGNPPLLSEEDRRVYEIFGINELFVKRWTDKSVENVDFLFDRQPFNFTSEEGESVKDSRAKLREELKAHAENAYDGLIELFSQHESMSSSSPQVEEGKWETFTCLIANTSNLREDRWKCPPQYLFGSIVMDSLSYPLSDRFLSNATKTISAKIHPNYYSLLLLLQSANICCEKSPSPKNLSLPIDLCQGNEPSAMVCEGNLRYRRNQLPQIEGHLLEEFLNYLSAQGVKIERDSLSATDLRPSQGEINRHVVKSILASYAAKKFNPCSSEILVSYDGNNIRFVIDGHHRYAACYMIGEKQHVIQINLPVKLILWVLSHFPGVQKFDLDNVV